MKGIIYIMTTAVSGLIKIGQTGNTNFQERMRFLEANGYYNVSGLKRFFAIEIDDYQEKERLLHEIFNKQRYNVATSRPSSKLLHKDSRINMRLHMQKSTTGQG
jgi:hypothetical protein